MKLNNFESALVYYSKGWFDKQTEYDKEMWLKRIWATTYIVSDNWYPDFYTAKTLLSLLSKISHTQNTVWFKDKDEFVLRLLSNMSPHPIFDRNYSITDSKSYWDKAVKSLFDILSQIQVKRGDRERDQMPEEIEMLEFEEILDWINNHEYVKDFEETTNHTNVKSNDRPGKGFPGPQIQNEGWGVNKREEIMKRCEELDPIWQAMKVGKKFRCIDDDGDICVEYLTGIDVSSKRPFITETNGFKHVQLVEAKITYRVKDPVSIMKALVDDGYKCDIDGNWWCKSKPHFFAVMFKYCGTIPSESGYEWLPEWLEVYE